MIDESASRRRALAFNAVGHAVNEAGCWLPFSARRTVADAVLAAIADPDAGYCPHCGRGDAGPTADQHEASQRRAVRIQQLLDDTRDRMRKDAAASREPERQLQQQIDQQAKEIDRLRDDRAGRTAESCGSCGAGPVTYYAPDGHPACADCAPCDCGTEPCSKPQVVALRAASDRTRAALVPAKDTPDA